MLGDKDAEESWTGERIKSQEKYVATRKHKKSKSKPSGTEKEPDLEPTIRQRRDAKLADKQQMIHSFVAP